ncbi:conserved membrane protein [Patulibacter medicamentivorans]|uniref:Conserved membrane protein n=1 Tax=Patulibacter medicamentivorans TaxID=1097667 RepID=H0E9A4_9ACTN|nr:DUF3556 domain-containing protein [Patulibacter medicamentivorans]EHN09743.1 conserved membrane protein [Patulibacter medicamentivorans]
MGLTTGNFPPVDPPTFLQKPYLERLKILSRHWAEYGFGAPKITMIIYLVRLIFWTILGGVLVATLTSDLPPFDPAKWWDEPIVWQKLVIWIMLIESLGMGGSWGPLSGHFKPFTAGFRHYFRLGTIRVPPWPTKVPGTAGDARTIVDVGLYTLLIAAYVAALAIPGQSDGDLNAILGLPNEGLMATASVVPILVLLGLIGLRDKTIFLAARSEQYIPALIFFAFFPFVDMIVAAKILIVMVWVGAGFSKLTKHFPFVIPPMVSNTPWLTSTKIKRAHYANFPEDLRPSKAGRFVAHIPGTAFEIIVPLILLFSTNDTITLAAVVVMLAYCVFIISCFPLATPIEWNVIFMFITGFLFLGHNSSAGYGLGDMDPALLALTVGGMLVFPIWGNIRPDQISFLPALRQYAGNWASGMWAFAPGAEEKLNQHVKKASKMQIDQLTELYGPDEASVVLYQLLGWRSMHSQGRGLNSVMINTLGADIDRYDLREAEFSCNALIAWNFGEGHLHNEILIDALQRRCNFEPGEFIVVWVESEPFANGRQQYWVRDAAVGIIERGSWSVDDCVSEQPWLPNGPIATEVTWRREGYERISYPGGRGQAAPAPAPAAVPAPAPVASGGAGSLAT